MSLNIDNARARLDRTIPSGAIVFTWPTEIDASNAQALITEIATTINVAGNSGPVVIDLQAVTFADSAALAALVWAQHRTAGRLILHRPSRRILRLLTLSGLRQYFDMTIAA